MGANDGAGTDDATRLILALCHEVGNLVAAIRLNAHLVSDELSAVELAEASCDIDDLSARVSGLLALVVPISGPAATPSSSSPGDVIRGVEEALEAYGGRGVDVVVLPVGEDLPEVEIAPHTLHDLITTLAYYAIEEARPRASVRVSASLSQSPAGVSFAIEDTGPEDELLRTWRNGALRGRVLCCVAADAILKRLGGDLRVERAGGRTRIELRLPPRQLGTGSPRGRAD